MRPINLHRFTDSLSRASFIPKNDRKKIIYRDNFFFSPQINFKKEDENEEKRDKSKKKNSKK